MTKSSPLNPSVPTAAVLLVSGGLDSAVLAWRLVHHGCRVLALLVDYDQRHRVELRHAHALVDRLRVGQEVADLGGCAHLLTGSSQTSPYVPVPAGEYTQASLAVTVVPNRNMILLSLAAGLAVSRGLGVVAYAAHGGDHPVYPDCRLPFAEAVDLAMRFGNLTPVSLYAPFLASSKADIVRMGSELGVPFELTWSCYDPVPDKATYARDPGRPAGVFSHCGRCSTCRARREAFEEAGVVDPTRYAA